MAAIGRFPLDDLHVRRLTLAAVLTLSAPVGAQSTEKIDYATLAAIRDEGFNRSQVMEHVTWLSDVHGPRLTGSPGMRRAGDWAKRQLTAWGLANVHEEAWPFGKGWSLVRYSAHMTEPQVMPILGWPKAWSPGTEGPVTAEVVLASVRTEADLARWRGKLRGKAVLTQPARAVRMLEGRIVLRMDEKDVAEAEAMPVPPARGAAPAAPAATPSAALPADRLARFWKEEGVVALLDRGSDSDLSAGGSDLSWQTQRTDGGTIFVGGGGSRGADAGQGILQLTLAVEHYNRMVRIAERGVPVTVELDVRVRFHDEGEVPNGFNVVAELPGSDPRLRDEVVILGAHMDSWHAGTGATDNATGTAAMMEALRILKTVGARPRRTIRVALWGGEEQGLLGSRAYVARHYGTATEPKPGHEKLAAYYNLDNGTGRIRGIWMQGNLALRPIFSQWIEPMKELGVTLLGPRAVSSTDHVPFENAGLPGFQFIQERLEYNSRTHHSNMDMVDHVQRDDLMQQAVVAASFAYLTAMRDEKLPRKPVARTVVQ